MATPSGFVRRTVGKLGAILVVAVVSSGVSIWYVNTRSSSERPNSQQLFKQYEEQEASAEVTYEAALKTALDAYKADKMAARKTYRSALAALAEERAFLEADTYRRRIPNYAQYKSKSKE